MSCSMLRHHRLHAFTPKTPPSSPSVTRLAAFYRKSSNVDYQRVTWSFRMDIDLDSTSPGPEPPQFLHPLLVQSTPLILHPQATPTPSKKRPHDAEGRSALGHPDQALTTPHQRVNARNQPRQSACHVVPGKSTRIILLAVMRGGHKRMAAPSRRSSCAPESWPPANFLRSPKSCHITDSIGGCSLLNYGLKTL
jgi:hypothetical protein